MELILCINFPFFNLNSALGYFSRLALLFFLILEPKKNINYYDSIIMFIVGTIVFISIVLLATLKFVNLDLFLGGYARFGEIRDFASISSNQMALSANVNYIAYYSSVSIACILFLIVRANRHSRVLYLILLYIFFVGALTFSRAYILTICSIFFLFIIQLCHGNKKSISIIASVFLLFIGFIIFLWSHPEYVEKYLLRFNSTDGILKDSRFTILKLYFDYLYQYPIRFFFGTGILPYKYVTKISTSMHNGLQQILVGYGIFGFIFFITGLLKSIFFATRNCKKDIVSFIPLVSVVLFTQTIQFLSPTELMLPFIIGIFSLKTMDEKVK
ncbi:MAG: O-antigen ligase family protein [Pleomorphochaeta sp.]